MLKRMINMRFRSKLILFVCFLFLTIACVQFAITAALFEDIVLRKSQTMFREIIAQIGIRLDTEISTRNQMIGHITNNPSVTYYMQDMTVRGISKEVIIPKIMQEVLKLNPGFYYNVEDFYILSNEVLPINCYYSTALDETDAYSKLILNRMTVEPKSFGSTIIWDDFYREPNYISAYAPIFDTHGAVALARVRFNKTFLGNIIDNVHISNDNIIAVADQRGNIIYSNNTAYIGRQYSELSEQDNYIIRTSLSHNNWLVLGAIPHSTVSNEVFKSNLTFSIIYLVAFLGALYAIVVYSKHVLQPLNTIMHGMVELQQGNLDTVLQANTSDEFAFIVENFNRMAYQLKSQINQIYTYQEAAHRATISNIEAKLNPHFLYNTLDSIYWMLVVKEDVEEADMVIRLSNMLRYSISYSNDLVPAWEDFAQLENFIELHKYRFEGQLHYTISLDESTKNTRIPKLLLQPIIENSIKHGFRDLAAIGLLEISSVCEGDDIIFILKDNGVGIPPDKMEHILVSGLGLRLTQDRLRYLYGDGYGISVESSLGNGTTVMVKIHRHPSLDPNRIFGTGSSNFNGQGAGGYLQ